MHINGTTQLLGLIGDPVAQARTPRMANDFLAQDADPFKVLLPMHVAAQDLAAFVSGLRRWQNFLGAVVTMPHKVAMAQLVDELTPQARLVGAVNVIRRESDGRLTGTILDGEGFIAGLAEAGHQVSGARCILSGAGGAASAIAFALAAHGCQSLHILNRTPEKAQELARRVQAQYPRTELRTGPASSDTTYDIAINGTKLGMQAGDPLPFAEDVVARSLLVAECVIAPELTPLLQLAQRQGRPAHTGVFMLSAQLQLMLAFMGAL